MIGKRIFTKILRISFITIFLFLLHHALFAENNNQPHECIFRADRRIIEIRSFPDAQYLHTLDGQKVLINEFYIKSLMFFPQCQLYKKFYYWRSEIREVVSNTNNGNIRHTIRCYNNCRSTFCPQMSDPLKTHGDVAEFYDRNGKFLGLSVYMGEGKYCALPYHGYRK